MIQIGLLGGLEIRVAGVVLETLSRRKAAALLALLALRPRQRHAREELASQLWPDADTETGRRNLRQTLLYLRQALEPQELVHADPQSLWLSEGVSTDLAAFEAAARAGQAEQARGLWRGELLPGFFEEAILTERERLKALWESLPRERPSVVPPPLARPTLPIYLSEFYGREAELERLSTLLAEPGARLVTLLGPGGIGKTRLAVTLVAGGKTEAAFVELATLPPESDERQLYQRIAQALALALPDQGDLEEGLLRLLASRPLLLILDNAEHVLLSVAAVALRLLQTAPRLRLLVTSREPLRLAGERVVSLEALPTGTAQQLLQATARAVRPELPDDSEALATICRHLEGLPIALELAASQCRSLTLRELAQDLSEGRRLAPSTSLDLPARHRSLEATLAWSEALLSPEQQRLLRWLSVFADGATREAALAVCQARAAELAALVEKSLVQAQIQPDGTTRYRFLEPVRQWAAEKLAQSGEESMAHRQLARWFLALAEQAAPELRRREQLSWLKRLDAERTNLSAAARHLEPRECLRLVHALRDYWQRRGLLHDGLSLTRTALSQGEAALSSPERDGALLTLGALLLAGGERERAQEPLELAARSSERTVAIEASLLLWANLTATSYEQYCTELAALQPLLDTDPALRWHRAQALLLGERFLNANDRQERQWELATQAGQLFEQEGDLTKSMEALFHMAGILLVQQRFDQAAPLLLRLQETAALLESTQIEVLALSMQIRAQRVLITPELGTLAGLAERLALLAPRLGVPMEAYNAWHDLLQASRYLGRWQQAQLARDRMLHFRQQTIAGALQSVYLLGAAASLCADTGAVAQGGRLYGYIQATRERLQVPPNPLEQRVYDRDLACLRTVGAPECEAALAVGRLLTFEEALACAQEPLVLPGEGSRPPLPPI